MSRIEIIRNFYHAFNQKDFATMNGCYAPEIEFFDPAFQQLKGDEVRAMWHMLCAAARDLSVTCTNARETSEGVRAHWEAIYTFSGTGRRVHNHIEATFTFRENQIIKHYDHFNMWRWTRMALGTPGLMMGWTGFFKNKVSTKARSNLQKFMKEHPEYQRESLAH